MVAHWPPATARLHGRRQRLRARRRDPARATPTSTRPSTPCWWSSPAPRRFAMTRPCMAHEETGRSRATRWKGALHGACRQDHASTSRSVPPSGARTDAIPFDATHRFMAVLHHDHEGHAWIHVKGAPERILAMCAAQRAADGGAEPLDADYWHADGRGTRRRGTARAGACRARRAPDQHDPERRRPGRHADA